VREDVGRGVVQRVVEIEDPDEMAVSCGCFPHPRPLSRRASGWGEVGCADLFEVSCDSPSSPALLHQGEGSFEPLSLPERGWGEVGCADLFEVSCDSPSSPALLHQGEGSFEPLSLRERGWGEGELTIQCPAAATSL